MGNLRTGYEKLKERMPASDKDYLEKYMEQAERAAFEEQQEAYLQGMLDVFQILQGTGVIRESETVENLIRQIENDLFNMKQIRCYANKTGLKPSFCYYKRWGTKKRNGQGLGPAYPLRFSESGKAEIEKVYVTHFLAPKRIEEIKTEEKCKNQN
ncbi:hypothetical protein [Frisingicoccus sp.]|uniref:hypothetical protein n=1 Tax=Frisingicoccus sp. TaxID=1918627 RepID=UPI003AB33820